MHIVITDIEGEKRINLIYLIQSMEVAVVSMFTDNIQYEFIEPWSIELKLGNMWITAGTYTRSELTDLIEGRIEFTQFDKKP